MITVNFHTLYTMKNRNPTATLAAKYTLNNAAANSSWVTQGVGIVKDKNVTHSRVSASHERYLFYLDECEKCSRCIVKAAGEVERKELAVS